MAVQPLQYETLLSTCSEYRGALALLREYRPYLEVIPSMRRPQESIITVPLPNVRLRQRVSLSLKGESPLGAGMGVTLPCEVALLMCDPEWKIKTGIEVLIFIHRPGEDFSALLMRWRQTQILMESGCEWMLPPCHEHLLSDGADVVRPLFVTFPDSPPRILRGLQGAGLAVVTAPPELTQLPLPEPPPEVDPALINPGEEWVDLADGAIAEDPEVFKEWGIES